VGRDFSFCLRSTSGRRVLAFCLIEKDTGTIAAADKALAQRRMGDFIVRMDAKPRIPPRAAGKDAPAASRRRG